jgi:hypothetical protein
MLQAVPAKARSAVMPLAVRMTLLALYPGHSTIRLTGMELPHGAKLAHRKRQAWMNILGEGMALRRAEVPLLANQD